MEIYFQVLGSCLEVVPWDACNRFLVDGSNTPPALCFEFCGYLIQLFYSLPDYEVNPAVREILNVFPNIFTWCFGKKVENHYYTCESQYIRHKILVQMIRRNSLINLHCDIVVSWLHLIEKYFQDLLSESVSEPEDDQDDCLKDSPFCESTFTKTGYFSLFKGFAALYRWVTKHLPSNILDNQELYDDSCKSFTKPFIQLYMHEDDMLFKILLQLTYTPFEYTQPITEDWVVEKDILFLLSDVFDPVRSFHLFLSVLHYDHQVLLDYLISKDIGASCAVYLLRHDKIS